MSRIVARMAATGEYSCDDPELVFAPGTIVAWNAYASRIVGIA